MAGALLVGGESIRNTAKLAGVTKHQVEQVKKDVDLLNSPKVRQLAKDIGAKFLLKADQAMQAITPEKIASSSADQLARVMDIANKNYRLTSGQSTENVSLSAQLARETDGKE